MSGAKINENLTTDFTDLHRFFFSLRSLRFVIFSGEARG
jgi:hypothetical protein